MTTTKTQINKAPAPIRRMPVRTKDIELKDEWAGWRFTAVTTVSLENVEDITSGDIGRIRKALADLIRAWNFVDAEGQPMAAPKDDKAEALMGRLPVELAMAMVAAISEAVQEASQ